MIELAAETAKDGFEPAKWWSGGILYHVYVRSFMDSGGDGVGDLRGAIDRLGYLSDLGVDGVWLSPIMPSPNCDWGYDVSEYLGVDPDLGTLDDLDEFIATANQLGIEVMLDLVPNHTSSEHPWFVSATSGIDSPHREYYVFADPRDDGSPPNNWLDATGEPAWTLDEASGQYYLHNYLPSQPDLNWWNEDVHAEFLRILRFWFDRGVAGFRIDVAHGIYKDRELRDDPPAIEADPHWARFGLRPVYSMNRGEVHSLFRTWRSLAEEYAKPRVLLGETWVPDVERMASFYGDGDELNLAFNFPFLFSEFEPLGLAKVVRETLSALPRGAVPVWTGSNHDVSRFPTRWARGSIKMTRMALLLLLTLPGTAVLYYGDELGAADVEVSPADQRDLMSAGRKGFQRDRARTPMLWNQKPGRGFTVPGVTPWLPFGSGKEVDVASQLGVDSSNLELARSLIRARKQFPEEALSYQELSVSAQGWRYQARGLSVFLNFSGEVQTISLPGTGDYISTGKLRLGEGTVSVGPLEAVVREKR